MMTKKWKKEIRNRINRAASIFEQLNAINVPSLLRPLFPDEINDLIYRIEFDYHSRDLYIKFYIKTDEHIEGKLSAELRQKKPSVIYNSYEYNSKMVLSYFKVSLFDNSWMRDAYIGMDKYHCYVMVKASKLAEHIEDFDKEYDEDKHFLDKYKEGYT